MNFRTHSRPGSSRADIPNLAGCGMRNLRPGPGIHMAVKQLGSPIEQLMLDALLQLEIEWCGTPSLDDCERFAEYRDIKRDGWGRAWLTPQARIDQYRVDFLFWIEHGLYREGVVIECDGHEFHERTKQQAERDKRRDRAIVAAGFPVLRFTGSEIVRDPAACAEEVLEPMRRALNNAVPDPGKGN